MVNRISECMNIEVVAPQFILNFNSGLMRFYPLFLRASLMLNRLVQ